MKSFRFFLLLCGLCAIVSCRKEEEPAPNTLGTPLDPSVLNHGEIWLTGQGWECYAACDSVTMDTLTRNDTLRFFADSVSWNNAQGNRYHGYYDRRDTTHLDFLMAGTPFGLIQGTTTVWQMRDCHISGIPFRNSTAHTTTYLWFRRLW